MHVVWIEHSFATKMVENYEGGAQDKKKYTCNLLGREKQSLMATPCKIINYVYSTY